MKDKTSQNKSAKGKNKWEKFSEEQEDAQPEAEEKISSRASLSQDTDLGIEFPDRQKLEDRLTAMEQVVDEYKDKNLRVMAEMKNAQERAERDISKAHKFGTEKLIVDLLPVVDSLVRGLESSVNDPQQNSIHEGMQLTLDLLIKTLTKHGVEVINPARGEAFNPEIHEAMSMQQDPKAKPNTILQVLQHGYALNGRVLRAAMVIVAS